MELFTPSIAIVTQLKKLHHFSHLALETSLQCNCSSKYSAAYGFLARVGEKSCFFDQNSNHIINQDFIEKKMFIQQEKFIFLRRPNGISIFHYFWLTKRLFFLFGFWKSDVRFSKTYLPKYLVLLCPILPEIPTYPKFGHPLWTFPEARIITERLLSDPPIILRSPSIKESVGNHDCLENKVQLNKKSTNLHILLMFFNPKLLNT